MKKILITFILLGIMISCNNKSVEIIEGNKIIKSEGIYYLEYDNTFIKLDLDTYITKERKLEDYISKGILSLKDNDLITDLKKYFPHGFKGITEGEKPSNFIEIPTILLENKKIIDSIKLSEELSKVNIEVLIEKDETKEEKTEEEVNLKGIKLAILNANGIDGFAKKFGNQLKEKLEIEYIAENYTNGANYNYIINHKLTEKQLDELVKNLGLKNVKILDNPTLKPEMDAVVILGNLTTNPFKVEIISKTGNEEIKSLLSTYPTTLVKNDKYNNENIADDTIVRYNKSDIYTAKEIKEKISNATLLEDDTLNDKIVITTK